jgi:hypothetical protein
MAMGNDSFTGIPSKDNEGINDGVRWVVVNGVGVDTPTTQYIKKKKKRPTAFVMFLPVVVCRDIGRFNVAKTHQQSISGSRAWRVNAIAFCRIIKRAKQETWG